jgi:hypothetical protein
MRLNIFLVMMGVLIACKTENSTEANISIQTIHSFNNGYLHVLVNGQTNREFSLKGKYNNWNLGYFPSNTQFSAQFKKSQTDSTGWVRFIWFKANSAVKQDSIFLGISDSIGVSAFFN